jgi:hypothetical protein
MREKFAAYGGVGTSIYASDVVGGIGCRVLSVVIPSFFFFSARE